MYLLSVLLVTIGLLFVAFVDDIVDWMQEHPIIEILFIIGFILLMAYGLYIW